MLAKDLLKQPFQFWSATLTFDSDYHRRSRLEVARYWRTAWNTTHKFFWLFLSFQRSASRLGFGRAAKRPAFRPTSMDMTRCEVDVVWKTQRPSAYLYRHWECQRKEEPSGSSFGQSSGCFRRYIRASSETPKLNAF
jgi:hypothetical protein